jgi:hypothetical protein
VLFLVGDLLAKAHGADLIVSFKYNIGTHSVFHTMSDLTALMTDFVLKNCGHARFRNDDPIKLFLEFGLTARKIVIEINQHTSQQRLVSSGLLDSTSV